MKFSLATRACAPGFLWTLPGKCCFLTANGKKGRGVISASDLAKRGGAISQGGSPDVRRSQQDSSLSADAGRSASRRQARAARIPAHLDTSWSLGDGRLCPRRLRREEAGAA